VPLTDGLDGLSDAFASLRPQKATIRAVKIHLPPDDHGTVTRRGIGFRATCECGERSRVVASWAMARGWLTEHRRGACSSS
jgi:hypothetical protein